MTRWTRIAGPAVRGLARANELAASPTLDMACSAALVVLVCASILIWQIVSLGVVLPFQDGSHHVANVADRAARLSGYGAQSLVADGLQDVSLAYAFFLLPTLVIGKGRLAFAIGWCICALLILGAVWLYFRGRRESLVRTLTISLFFALSLFQALLGGARDTRIDLLAITFSFLALLLLVAGRRADASVLMVASCFAKGAAVSLLIPLGVLEVVLFRFAPLRVRRIPRAATALKIVVAAVGLYVFVSQLGSQTVFYNLMAAGGSDTADRTGNFIVNATGYLLRDPLFYLKDLRGSGRGWLVIAGGLALLVYGARRGWNRCDLRLGAFSMLALAYAYVLLTVSPLHSTVLTVWLLPALGLVAVFVADAITRQLGLVTIPATAVALLLFVPGLRPLPSPRPGLAATDVDNIVAQADDIAGYLAGRFGAEPVTIGIVANFLYFDELGSSNVDDYRVLIQEHLPRSSKVVLDGWEFGPFSSDWKPSVVVGESYQHLILVLQEHPEAIETDNFPQRNGNAVWQWVHTFAAVHPDCIHEAGRTVSLGAAGLREALVLDDRQQCREAFFQAAT